MLTIFAVSPLREDGAGGGAESGQRQTGGVFTAQGALLATPAVAEALTAADSTNNDLVGPCGLIEGFRSFHLSFYSKYNLNLPTDNFL